MGSRYASDAARLKAVILARVRAKEALRAVCASPGMPCEATARNWAKADPPFGMALAAAQTARAEARREAWPWDEALAEAFLLRVRNGERVKDLLRTPGMPSRRTYRYWIATQAPFAEAMFANRMRSNQAIGGHGRKRRRDFDQALADRIIVRLARGERLAAALAADPELPCWDTLKRWRREQPEFHSVLRKLIAARRRMMRPVPDAVVEDVAGHIVEGGTFASYSRQPGAPSHGTLRRWLRDPNFADEVERACDLRDDWARDQLLWIAERKPLASKRDLDRAAGPLKRKLAHQRPGTPHRK